MKEFDARVLRVIDDWVVLDATAFYPEGGGQPADLGELNGVKVLDVQKVGKVILHRVEKPEAFAEGGQEVHGRIDWNRRIQHMRHHTGTHVLMGGRSSGSLGSTSGRPAPSSRRTGPGSTSPTTSA